MDKRHVIQEFAPGRQVALAYLTVHPGEELAEKIGVSSAGAIGITTPTPRKTTMITDDLVLKAAGVHTGLLDRFSSAPMTYGSVGAVGETLLQIVSGLGRLLNCILCEMAGS